MSKPEYLKLDAEAVRLQMRMNTPAIMFAESPKQEAKIIDFV